MNLLEIESGKRVVMATLILRTVKARHTAVIMMGEGEADVDEGEGAAVGGQEEVVVVDQTEMEVMPESVHGKTRTKPVEGTITGRRGMIRRWRGVVVPLLDDVCCRPVLERSGS